MQNTHDFDVIVVGAGHAGCEAALVAARMGMRTALISMRLDLAANMPCNPSIGGIAKSHLVFEVDALGGEIARNADFTGIQFRVLNTRKGPAVQANRVQCDKAAYSARMQEVLKTCAGLDCVAAEVAGLIVEDGHVRGVRLYDDETLGASRVVIASGTSLAGAIHIGSGKTAGGGGGLPAASELSENLRGIGFRLARLKTGTPPRLAGRSLDYGRMDVQPGIEPPAFFSWEGVCMFHVEHPDSPNAESSMFHVEHRPPPLCPWHPGSNQIPCYLTHTTWNTHSIIRDNLRRSALYGGHITGTGVRYCPSVEDKIVKFPDKASHHVFLEPEGRETDLVYPNGISNSLPESVQADLVHSIPGLEKAEIVAWGYAIEYDFADPTQLRHTLESKRIKGLYLAGQVCGTTGYEEAAALGFMAGANAALAARSEPPCVLGRDEAYIGVMIDDLVTKGTDEPYRMFTSRAEHRLLLRQDNARYRLVDTARRLGVAAPAFVEETSRHAETIATELTRLTGERADGHRLVELLRRPAMHYNSLPGARRDLPAVVTKQVEIEVKYEGYIRRELEAVDRLKSMESLQLPDTIDYMTIASLRLEAREKLSRIEPATLGQAARIPGINPADISVLAVMAKRLTIDEQPNDELGCMG